MFFKKNRKKKFKPSKCAYFDAIKALGILRENISANTLDQIDIESHAECLYKEPSVLFEAINVYKINCLDFEKCYSSIIKSGLTGVMINFAILLSNNTHPWSIDIDKHKISKLQEIVCKYSAQSAGIFARHVTGADLEYCFNAALNSVIGCYKFDALTNFAKNFELSQDKLDKIHDFVFSLDGSYVIKFCREVKTADLKRAHEYFEKNTTYLPWFKELILEKIRAKEECEEKNRKEIYNNQLITNFISEL